MRKRLSIYDGPAPCPAMTVTVHNCRSHRNEECLKEDKKSPQEASRGIIPVHGENFRS